MCPHLWFKKLLPLTLILAGAIACRSVKEEPTKEVHASATPLQVDGRPITRYGQNFEPSFSPDGQKMVFVSATRPQHRQAQIYEMDLKTGKEKRITFQGVATHGPQYSPHGEAILYSSATDELQESPPLLQADKTASNFAGPALYLEPTELYLHHLSGLSMQRLTKHPGYDGEARFFSGKEIVFTRRNDKDLLLLETTIGSNSAHPWKGPGARAAQFAAAIPTKRYAWIEYAEDFQTSQLKVKDGKDVYTLLDSTNALKKDPTWTPDGETLVFAMNSPTKEKFQIYAIKRDGTCLTALTKNDAISDQPAVSPTGDAVLFVSNQNGMRQIYLQAFPKELHCPPPAPPTKATEPVSPATPALAPDPHSG